MEPDTKPAASATGASRSADTDMLEPGENILTVVRRSLIGLVGIYLVAVAAVAALLGLIIAISPAAFEDTSGGFSASLMAIIMLAALLLGLFLFTSTYIYLQSKLLVTDRSLVQIMQKTLFSRKVSRLSMSNVEDVNEEQNGFLATLFNYGTLTVQTAGTEDNFIFTLCPNPTRLADKIIEARQNYAKSHVNE